MIQPNISFTKTSHYMLHFLYLFIKTAVRNDIKFNLYIRVGRTLYRKNKVITIEFNNFKPFYTRIFGLL